MSIKYRSILDMDDATRRRFVGQRIQTYRKKHKWTQQELAEATHANLSTALISRYENGHVDMQLSTYLALVKALGVSPNDLVAWGPSPLSLTDGRAEYELLSEDSQRMIDRIIHALVIEQKLGNG